MLKQLWKVFTIRAHGTTSQLYAGLNFRFCGHLYMYVWHCIIMKSKLKPCIFLIWPHISSAIEVAVRGVPGKQYLIFDAINRSCI